MFFSKRAFLTLCLAAVMLTAAFPALANIMIMPVRITFQSRDRMQDITVINPSQTQAATYNLAWLFTEQLEDGGYARRETPLNPELDPKTAILFSPRQVSLPPGGKQRVRLSLRRPANLPDGEYRAHLYLKSATRQPAGSMHAKAGEEGVAIGMGMHVGVAVPVIIRQGAYDGTATIGTPKFVPGSLARKTPPQIEFYINRGGKFSTNGRVMVYWTPPDGEEEKLIARQNGVNIFHEMPRRLMRIPLKVTQIAGGTVRIVFEGDGPDKGITFDEKTFPVGG